MPAYSVRLMFAILAAPVAAMGLAQAAQAAPDRYGFPVYAPPETAEAAPSVYLNWPGKTPPAPPVQSAAPAPVTLAGGPPPGQAMAPANIYDKTPARPVSRLRIQTDARAVRITHLLRQAEPIGAARPARRLRVASHTRPSHVTRIIRVVQVVREAPEPAPAAAPRPQAQAQPQPVQAAAAQPVAAPAPQPAAIAANGLAPHFYSVQRQFGVQPDPIPLPAQFFGDSPATDLAAAPPPLPPRVILGQGASSTASVQRAVAAANLAAGDANTSN